MAEQIRWCVGWGHEVTVLNTLKDNRWVVRDLTTGDEDVRSDIIDLTGWKRHVCFGNHCDCDDGEVMYFPPDEEWVTVINATEAREVGDEDIYQIPAGARGEVMGVWEACHDVHVKVEGVDEVWIDPTNLKPRHMIQVKPVVITDGDVADATPEEATHFGVYLGAPGRFEWQQDFPTAKEARRYADELGTRLGVSDVEDLSAHVVVEEG